MLRGMSRTVRLSPLAEEHVLPLLVDLGFFAVLGGALTFGVGEPRGAGAVGLVALVVAFHFAQVRALVTLRFDDEGVTVVRPWRRRRVAWKDVAGLVYTTGGGTGMSGRTYYRLRVVLKGQEPPLGRYMTDRQLMPYAGGPVLMTLSNLDPGQEGRAAERRDQVFAELERYGFPRPAPTAMEFRLPGFSPLALRTAIAVHIVGASAVHIAHGADPDERERELLDRTLPELARAHGATETPLREPSFIGFTFEAPQGAEAAAGFLAEAAALVPAHWQTGPGLLPGVPEAPAPDPAPDRP